MKTCEIYAIWEKFPFLCHLGIMPFGKLPKKADQIFCLPVGLFCIFQLQKDALDYAWAKFSCLLLTFDMDGIPTYIHRVYCIKSPNGNHLATLPKRRTVIVVTFGFSQKLTVPSIDANFGCFVKNVNSVSPLKLILPYDGIFFGL